MRHVLGRRRRVPGLHDLLGNGSDLLVLTAPGSDPRRSHPELPMVVHALTQPAPRPGEHDTVLLSVPDLVGLRHAATGVPNVGTARRVVVRFDRQVDRLPGVVPRPQWPAVDELVTGRSPDCFVMLSFTEPVQARQVLLEVARAAAPSGRLAVGWPSLGVARKAPEQWPPADPSAKVALVPRLLDQSVDSPPDLVLLDPDAADRPDLPQADHHVLGRPSRWVVVEPELTWDRLAELSPADSMQQLARRGVSSLGAVDEQLINPMGFRDAPGGRLLPLAAGKGATLQVGTSTLHPDHTLSDADLPRLRDLGGVRLDWSGGRGPQAYCRAVVQLAMAGVPLVTERVPDWAGHLLPADLVDVLASPVELGDRLRREEHSVRARRAALRNCSSGAWRRQLAQRHGLQYADEPTVSVLLATRRPGMLPFALRQVARQRGVRLEVVLAAHGFDPDPSLLDGFREASGTPLRVVAVDERKSFGQVLNASAAAAGGDLLVKMDDDDWYGPDFVGDLVMAQQYSGAQLVGAPADFTFLQPLWLTTRGNVPTEVHRPWVAGGTLLVERGTLRSLGGFRDATRFVDAQLLSAVSSAGGSIYRTHGLGYVLRRGGGGHTWDPGLGYFLTAERTVDQWRGFQPSALLEAADIDRPDRHGDSIEAR